MPIAPDDNLILEATNLSSSDINDCTVTFAGVQSDKCRIDSGNIMVSYNLGVPLPLTSESPKLSVKFKNSGITAWHNVCSADTVSNLYAGPTGTQTSISCSFAGGCTHTIAADGLASNVDYGHMKVTVCGQESKLVAAESGIS